MKNKSKDRRQITLKYFSNAFRSPTSKSTISTTLVLGTRLALQTGTLIILAHLLGAKDFGVFAGISGLALIIGSLGTLGTHLVLLSEISKKGKTRTEILAYSIPTTIITGTSLFSLYLCISLWILTGSKISMTTVALLGASEIILQPLISLISMDLLAIGRAAKSQLLGVIPLFFRFFAAAIILIANPNNSIELFAFGYLLFTFASLIMAHKSLSNPWPELNRMRLPKKGEIKYALGYAILNAAYQSPAEVDKIISVKLTSPEIAGAYAIGARITGALALPIIGMLITLIPKLFAENNQESIKKKSRTNLFILIASLLYGSISGAFLYLLTPVIVEIFGKEYNYISAMMPIFSVALAGLAFRLAIGDILMSYSLPWRRAGLEAFGIIFLIGSALIATQYQPILGIAIALASAEWAMSALGIIMIIIINKKQGSMQ